MLHELHQPVVVHPVEVRAEIGLQYVVHLPFLDAAAQLVEAVVHPAFRAVPVTAWQEHRFVHGPEEIRQRELHQLVLETTDRQGALLVAPRLFDPHPFRRARSVGATVQAVDEVAEVLLQPLAVGPLGGPVDPDRLVGGQALEAVAEVLLVDHEVEHAVEACVRVAPRHAGYLSQLRVHPESPFGDGRMRGSDRWNGRVGRFAPRALPRFSANLGGVPRPIPRPVTLRRALFTLRRLTRLLRLRSAALSSGVIPVSPGWCRDPCSSMRSSTPVLGAVLVRGVPRPSPAPRMKGSASGTNPFFSELCFRFSTTCFTSLHSFFSLGHVASVIKLPGG